MAKVTGQPKALLKLPKELPSNIVSGFAALLTLITNFIDIILMLNALRIRFH